LAAAQTPPRPRFTGLAHVALYVRDIEQARWFYKELLGFGEPFQLNQPDGRLSLTFIKVNDRQYIELFPEAEPGTDRLHHISIEVDNAEAMRAYLHARGVPVPDKAPKGRIGNSNFNVKDPDGHTVEIVQYEPDGWSMREKGKHLGDGRVSKRILHLGILVGALEPALRFYRDLLGFRETWRGSRNGKVLDWVNLQVPEGDDYLEFMLYNELPAPNARGVAHHIALEVPDMARAVAHLDARPARKRYTRPVETRVGINRKRQLNLFDPDGTRVELMEPHTVDGVPAPPSAAPPPR
jgi:lactoylglutathione lyase